MCRRRHSGGWPAAPTGCSTCFRHMHARGQAVGRQAGLRASWPLHRLRAPADEAVVCMHHEGPRAQGRARARAGPGQTHRAAKMAILYLSPELPATSTGCTTRLGSQLWLMKRATLPAGGRRAAGQAEQSRVSGAGWHERARHGMAGPAGPAAAEAPAQPERRAAAALKAPKFLQAALPPAQRLPLHAAPARPTHPRCAHPPSGARLPSPPAAPAAAAAAGGRARSAWGRCSAPGSGPCRKSKSRRPPPHARAAPARAQQGQGQGHAQGRAGRGGEGP